MKMLTFSSVIVLTFVFLSSFVPEASARCRKNHSSFGFSVNVGGPDYVVAPAPVVVPPPVYTTAPTVYAAPAPVYPGYVTPAPYPYYYSAPAPVVVQRPATVVVERPAGYVRPGFSYSYWRGR
ncbi:MAG: hypothetical protein ACH350_04215 [Parachlamydiaceae bacterium]